MQASAARNIKARLLWQQAVAASIRRYPNTLSLRSLTPLYIWHMKEVSAPNALAIWGHTLTELILHF